jgi:hypothetical protein
VGEQGCRKRDSSSRRLWTALREIDRYLTSQSAWLVNYAERQRAGLRVGTSLTEGTANFLVNRRMNKSQQMRWSRRGADLLLQVRCAVLNGKLGSGFGKLFKAEVDPVTAVYASRSPTTPQHSLPCGRYSLPGPDFHRLDRASFARRTQTASYFACPLPGFLEKKENIGPHI